MLWLEAFGNPLVYLIAPTGVGKLQTRPLKGCWGLLRGAWVNWGARLGSFVAIKLSKVGAGRTHSEPGKLLRETQLRRES